MWRVKVFARLWDVSKRGIAVAALSERRNSLKIHVRRSETAATKIELTHYPIRLLLSPPLRSQNFANFQQ